MAPFEERKYNQERTLANSPLSSGIVCSPLGWFGLAEH
jgi:hypothetical protein